MVCIIYAGTQSEPNRFKTIQNHKNLNTEKARENILEFLKEQSTTPLSALDTKVFSVFLSKVDKHWDKFSYITKTEPERTYTVCVHGDKHLIRSIFKRVSAPRIDECSYENDLKGLLKEAFYESENLLKVSIGSVGHPKLLIEHPKTPKTKPSNRCIIS